MAGEAGTVGHDERSSGLLVWGVAALAAAILPGWIVYALNEAYPANHTAAMVRVAAVFLVLLVVPQLVLFARRRRQFDYGEAALVALVTLVILLVGVFYGRMIHYVLVPADILNWSESDFINDIIKLRTGYPLYSDQTNNDAYFYTPGAQVLTWLLAAAVGQGDSIPAMRLVQLGYVALASLFGVLIVRRLLRLAAPDRPLGPAPLWVALWAALLFLVGTNRLTNTYAFNLHNDSLALLTSVIAYWLLVQYATTRRTGWLIAMAVIPAAGFMVKQSLVVWLGLAGAWLLFFDRPFRFWRVALWGAGSAALVAATIGACYLIWGEPFFYWTFDVMSKHGVSPIRSFDHLLDTWAYVAVGLAGGAVLLRGAAVSRLLGLWLVWLVFIALEIYTSGIASMLNHIGPGSMIAGMWMIAALTYAWPAVTGMGRARPWTESLVSAGATMAAVALLLNGLGTVRIPVRPLSPDLYRYIRDIEAEFQDVNTADVLLDAGSWMYMREGIVMKDRAPSIGERGYSGTGDFSAFIRRIEEKRYARILVRNLHADAFWYDHYSWDESSGIRDALLTHYQETAVIPAVHGEGLQADNWYLFADVSVLTPKTEPNDDVQDRSSASH